MNKRLEQFLAAENISQAQFADEIHVARASVSHILAGRNKPSYDFITGMLEQFPRLNPEWLLTGRVKMYKDPLVAEQPDRAQLPVPDLFSAPILSLTSRRRITPRESRIRLLALPSLRNLPCRKRIPPPQNRRKQLILSAKL